MRRLKAEGKSLKEIAQIIQPQFPDRTEHQVWEMAHSATRKRITMDDRPIGVFSDPHIPFNHPNYLQFCIDTFRQYHVGRIVCLGDLVDFHAISRHETETCAKSPIDELDMTIAGVKQFTDAFPDVDFIPGNHDLIYIRQAATLGIDKRFLKSFKELFELPKKWRIHDDEYISDGILYKHGINCAGKNGAINTAIQERMSTVIGHSHAFGGCQYSANPRDIIFGLNVGCGIHISQYAFAYGKHAKNRPTLGCGVVFNSASAIFIPMSAGYFRD